MNTLAYNPYTVFGNISRETTPEDIKRTYRILVKRFHPDLNPDNPDAAKKMCEINEAYAILTDSTKRALLDQTLKIEEDRMRQKQIEREHQQNRMRHAQAQRFHANTRPLSNANNPGVFLGVALGLAAVALITAVILQEE